MNISEIAHILPFVVALYATLICGLLLFRYLRNADSTTEKKRLKIVVAAYFLAMVGWMSLIMYISLPSLFVIFNSLIMFVYMAIHIFLYSFVFEITKVNKEEKFAVAHYFLPTLVAAALFVWSLFVPFSVQLHLVESRGALAEEYKLYSMFFLSKPLLLFVYNIIYGLLGFRRTIRYRKVLVNYSADEQRISLSWLYHFFFLMMGTLPMALIALLVSRDLASLSWITLLPISFALFGYIVLAHNVLLDNYVIIKPDSAERELLAQRAEEYSEPITSDDVRRLEAYMRKHKPYLNPKLKITDMTEELNTNRTSLSRLINRTYGMNFSRYINRFRLDELEKIKSDPRNGGLGVLELVANAGFSDFRGYQRTQRREEREIQP